MNRVSTEHKDKRKSTRYWGLASLFLAAAAATLLTNTTPDRVGPIGITVFFLVLMLGLFSSGMWLRSILFKSPKSTSLLAVILLATLSVSALALNTISIQLGEILLLLMFALTLIIYWTKLR